MPQPKKGLLLLNLGTPKSAKTKDVRQYLRQFLSDPQVIQLPALIRFLLVNVIIAPFRAPKSAKAYAAIWTKAGSPLLINSQNVAKKLTDVMGDKTIVALGMRYGEPSIKTAVDALTKHACDDITILPLFPHYAESTSASAIANALSYLARTPAKVNVIKDYFDNPGYIKALSARIKPYLQKDAPEKVIFSYHGLPVSHVQKMEPSGFCDQTKACPKVGVNNRRCYRAQCYATSRLLADALGLNSEDYYISFQSRLGKTPWIGPYTDQLLITLRHEGISNIAIACPSFVSDCLETLEEINIRARQQWQALGGKSFSFIPSLNATDLWVSALHQLAKGSDNS